ncbi:hypothetical protein [Paenibacillus piri]|uniref:Uncharacterized protein n=1 Tax=Paenibacillus piri TaxID=2547395 RepID=A0A4R5KQQ2_9BACL|nr:hypothetical protein [Paenibacillus piri]TDF98093.1 hypothetical protein E1757_11335 [Paenibacillus piri]
MNQTIVREEEPRMLPAVTALEAMPEQTGKQPKKPRLTLKMLQAHICRLEEENAALAQRINQLEQRTETAIPALAETAAAAESIAGTETSVSIGETDSGFCTVAPLAIRTPRSERHPSPKKQSVWNRIRSFWF